MFLGITFIENTQVGRCSTFVKHQHYKISRPRKESRRYILNSFRTRKYLAFSYVLNAAAAHLLSSQFHDVIIIS